MDRIYLAIIASALLLLLLGATGLYVSRSHAARAHGRFLGLTIDQAKRDRPAGAESDRH